MSWFLDKIESADPYIIAEIGVNHEGSLDTAKKLIDLAKAGGADAVKFQTYKAEKIASKNSPSYWDRTKEPTSSQYELFKKFDKFGQSEYKELYEYCKNVQIDFLSTPFDLQAVDFLDPLMPCIKIASADLTNIPLLRKAGSKKKPILISTGAANIEEIQRAVEELKNSGAEEIVLLHCVLNYPTPVENAHLGMIKGLDKAFPHHMLGYSDHTMPDEDMNALSTAWLLGAKVLEKHFTHDKSLPGNDHYHAMDYNDCRRVRNKIDLLKKYIGKEEAKFALKEEEVARQNARRSIVAAKNLKKGHVLVETDLICKRPAFGISPIHWDRLIGSELLKDVSEDSIIEWEDVLSDG